MAILTLLILPIYDQGRSLCFLVSSSIYFFSNFEPVLHKSFTGLELSQDIFEAVVNGTYSLISFSVCLLFMYRKATDFCVLILYSVENVNQLLW